MPPRLLERFTAEDEVGRWISEVIPVPIPAVVTRFNKAVLNRAVVHLSGHGWFVELEHVGRRTGQTHRVPLMAFDRGVVVTIALTYGPGVDWLANLRAAGRGRMHLRSERLTLGTPRDLPEEEGRSRMPQPPKVLLPLLGCHEYVEIPVLVRAPFNGW